MATDELSECVQDFYHNLSERLQTQFKGTADLQDPRAHTKYHRHLPDVVCVIHFNFV